MEQSLGCYQLIKIRYVHPQFLHDFFDDRLFHNLRDFTLQVRKCLSFVAISDMYFQIMRSKSATVDTCDTPPP